MEVNQTQFSLHVKREQLFKKGEKEAKFLTEPVLLQIDSNNK